MSLSEISSNKTFHGHQKVFSFESKTLNCTTKFGIFLPSQIEDGQRLPVIYFLSGLTCTEANFIEKAGAQRYANDFGVVLVNPDTSPRGDQVPDDAASYDFGIGAGFYLNATQEKWLKHYKMFDFVTKELQEVVEKNFLVDPDRKSIMGHSMGGHGALISALKNPGMYKSVSSFAAISNPIKCAWGQKAFKGYLGEDEALWKEWDATELVKQYNGPPLELFLDQGLEDQFLEQGQLLPDNLVEACKSSGVPVILKKRQGYNHSYFYISSFIGEHIAYHATHLL